MTEQEERLARERAEIAARVASFKETQQKFERERKIPVTGQVSDRLVRELATVTGRPID